MSDFLRVPLIPQPDFPERDITDKNREFLELFVQNEDIVNGIHTATHSTDPLFRLTHPEILRRANANTKGARVEATSFGVVAFETIAALMGRRYSVGDARASMFIMPAALAGNMFVDASEASEVMKSELPNTSAVICASSARFFRGLEGYALFGAAIERDIARQAVDLSLAARMK